MDGATIEGDNLPDDYTGCVFTFNPNNHKVLIAGSLVDWPEPGSQVNLELTREGSEPGVTIAEGSEQFLNSLLFPVMTQHGVIVNGMATRTGLLILYQEETISVTGVTNP